MTARAIIFDLGNVLVDFDHSIAAKKIARFCDKSVKEIYDFFFDSELTGLFEEGKISSLDFFSQVREKLSLKLGYEQFLPIWNEIFSQSQKNRAVNALAASLSQRYKVALLSNINILHFDYLKNNFPIFGPFHNLFLSFELKLKKPDPRIYKKALQVLQVEPEEVFYTDDRKELVEASRKLGIRGFVFSGVEQLEKDLLNSGIV